MEDEEQSSSDAEEGEAGESSVGGVGTAPLQVSQLDGEVDQRIESPPRSPLTPASQRADLDWGSPPKDDGFVSTLVSTTSRLGAGCGDDHQRLFSGAQ